MNATAGNSCVPEGAACPVCHDARSDFFAWGRDRLFRLAQGRFSLRRCLSCGSVYQDPLPKESELSAFYPELYWWEAESGPPCGGTRFLSRLEETYREFVARDHVRFLERCAGRGSSEGRPLLDIGCGSGTFLSLARRRGFACCGMDASDRAAALARKQYGLDVRQGSVGAAIWEERSFDFVTMFHVLEHLADPGAGLRYARRLLKPGGSLIVQVPNVASYQARAFRQRWYGIDVPRHVVNFTPPALELLLRKTGYEIARKARFSLRDNPASIASSIAVSLDPVGRRARGLRSGALVEAAIEFLYFGLVLSSLPAELLESALGRGGTIWVHARPVGQSFS
jgi:2-polyprenyl-3-methyl-5-hydroxy-6-metoxy-1,4-benzoquinol methylase